MPTLLTTIGMFGTFVGIAIGLMDFDVTNINASIEDLLSGMKTAFISSLVGMFFALAFKVIESIGTFDIFKKEITSDDISPKDVYKVLSDNLEQTKLISKSLNDSEESSLVGQIKLMRSDVNDNAKNLINDLKTIEESKSKDFEAFQVRLWNKLNDFADLMSKSATEQIIEALKNVITDFNKNLVEQFGDNFKELNQAVFKLVEWQENYKTQIEQMIEQYSLGVASIDETKGAVNNIKENTQVIPENMKSLNEIMTINQNQINELNNHLQAFAEVRDKAVNAIPEIGKQIDTTLDGVKSASDKLSEGMLKASKELQTAIISGSEEFVTNSQKVNESLQGSSDVIAGNSEKIKEQFSDTVSDINNQFRDLIIKISEENTKVANEIKSTSESMTNEIQNVLGQLNEQIASASEEQRSQALNILNGLRESIEKTLADTNESVVKHIGTLDESMGHEINNVMNHMGKALAQISGQFTSDYEQLVLAMKKITNT